MNRLTSNYKILHLVGRGQFGKVFAAVERHSGNLVALKELNSQNLSTSNFLREFNFLVSLNHFNITTCQALEHYNNHRYLIMDYCEGGTLRSLLDNSHPPNILQSLKLVIDILTGLHFAHQRQIIHRDLKPENILLKLGDRCWSAHIADFGIAQLYQDSESRTMGSTGSPAYMAPEQFYGKYSYSCDLYAVGIMLYELVVGQRPFSGMPQELQIAHLNQPVIVPKNLPYILRIAISKALQKMPQKRFSNAIAMREALQLAQRVITAESSLQLSSKITNSLMKLTYIDTSQIDYPITHLAIANEQIYLGSNQQLYLKSLANPLSEDTKVPLADAITNFQLTTPGCFVGTQSAIYFIPHRTVQGNFCWINKILLPLAVFPTQNLTYTVDSQGYWLGVSYRPNKSRKPVWELFQLPNWQSRCSQINRPDWQHLIALDNRHGLGICQTLDQITEFHLFNRRGQWLANFTARVQLEQIIYHPGFPEQLIALESNSASVILINLAKFCCSRILLNFIPSVFTLTTQGYLLSSSLGEMNLIDGHNQNITTYRIQLPGKSTVSAIALSATELYVATSQNSDTYLSRFEWLGK